jgi:diguanylate cyclase (GGDEF)-like protein
MSAASTQRAPRRHSQLLVASLCLAASFAYAQPGTPLAQQLAGTREISRFVPDRALPILLKMEPAARNASAQDKGEYLAQLCSTYLELSKFDQAAAAADELLAFGRTTKNDAVLAKGMLRKAYVLFARDQAAESHRMIWEAEKLAAGISDGETRVRSVISSGQSYEEEGNFPKALEKLQAAASLARENGDPVQIVMALQSLAQLYSTLHEYDKGFAALAEGIAAAEQSHSPGRVASLKFTEYSLASDAGQPARARAALLVALRAYRKIGARWDVARALDNLADSYLQLHDYNSALEYANQAYEDGRELNDPRIMYVARMNMGEAYIGKGRIAEGKRSVEDGLRLIEKQGDKPRLQSSLAEYGRALEAVGDMAGAVNAYHRERALSDELFERRRQKATLEVQAKYEAAQKQQQIVLLRREMQVKSAELDNKRLQQRVWWLLALVCALSLIIVYSLYRKVRTTNAQLEEKNQELKQQSVRDPLTGLYNRRHFQEFMRADLQQEKRGAGATGEEMVGALFLLDVDHFKHINDSSGHAAGDSVLKEIAASLREILRETDMIVRWGGEEFLAFLPAIPKSGLDEVARRLLTGISSKVIDHQGKPLSANVSIGFAPYPIAPGGQQLSWERAVNLVDMALYLAKAHGRNRAYGVRGFANFEQTSMEEVEQDLELAWRAGTVDLSIVLGGAWPELRAAG